MIIDIICPYCCNKLSAEYLCEKRTTYASANGTTTLTRKYYAWCDVCDVSLSLDVSARLEDD